MKYNLTGTKEMNMDSFRNWKIAKHWKRTSKKSKEK